MKASAVVPKSFFIPSLDGLRAISILIVFLSHAGLSRIVPGLLGVTVFFFLSGYLITTLLRLEYDQTGGVRLGDFYWRRVLRIFPPLYLTLGITVLVVGAGWLTGSFTWSAVAAQAVYLANYHEIFGSGGQAPGTEVLWSLAVEEHFYLVFPLLYLLLRRWLPTGRQQFQVLAGLAGAVLLWRMALVYGWHVIPLDPKVTHHPRICHATDTRFDSLLFGCILAVWGNPVLDATRWGRRSWLYIGVPAGLILLAVTLVLRDPGFRETFRYTLQGLALFPLFIATIRYADAPVFRCLNWRWVRFLGVLSYSIYLTHTLVIIGIQQAWPVPAGMVGSAKTGWLIGQGVAAFGLSIGAAWLMHVWVEKPCARLRKRFSHVQAPSAAGGKGTGQ